jgi:hypothetical protein
MCNHSRDQNALERDAKLGFYAKNQAKIGFSSRQHAREPMYAYIYAYIGVYIYVGLYTPVYACFRAFAEYTLIYIRIYTYDVYTYIRLAQP